MDMPKQIQKNLKKIQKKQPAMLAVDEVLLSAFDAVPIKKAQPPSIAMQFGIVGVLIGTAIDKSKLGARELDVKQAAGSAHVELSDLPESKSGFTVALTNKRVIVFDGRLKTQILDSNIAEIDVTAIPHAGGMLSVAMKHNANLLAITSRRSQEKSAEHFVSQFPKHGALRPRTPAHQY